jgi:hypothetical protein
MKYSKHFFVLLLISLCIKSNALDLDTDFFSIDPSTFVADQSNTLEKGNVIKNGYQTYYGLSIEYSITAKKDNPGSIYIFYSAPENKNEEFYSFYKDMVQYYLDKTYIAAIDTSYASDEIEPHIYIDIPNKPAAVIYSKYTPNNGIRGFGITYTEYQSGNITIDKSLFIDAAFYGNRKSKVVDNLKYSDLNDGIAYICKKYIGDKTKWSWSPSKEDINEWGALSNSDVIYQDQNIDISNKFTIKIKLKDESLKSNIILNSSYIEFSNGSIVSIYDILNSKDDGYILYTNSDLLGFKYYLYVEDGKVDSYLSNFTIVIEPNK